MYRVTERQDFSYDKWHLYSADYSTLTTIIHSDMQGAELPIRSDTSLPIQSTYTPTEQFGVQSLAQGHFKMQLKPEIEPPTFLLMCVVCFVYSLLLEVQFVFEELNKVWQIYIIFVWCNSVLL